MERKQKIDLLKGIATGTKTINDLNVRHDLFVCDEPEKHQHLLWHLNKDNIVTLKEYEQLCEQGLVKGAVFGIYPFFIHLHLP